MTTTTMKALKPHQNAYILIALVTVPFWALLLATITFVGITAYSQTLHLPTNIRIIGILIITATGSLLVGFGLSYGLLQRIHKKSPAAGSTSNDNEMATFRKGHRRSAAVSGFVPPSENEEHGTLSTPPSTTPTKLSSMFTCLTTFLKRLIHRPRLPTITITAPTPTPPSPILKPRYSVVHKGKGYPNPLTAHPVVVEGRGEE